jgi:Dickkopf N-terminal cysteine-rich region
MRSLILVTILCLTSVPAFACMRDNECEQGNTCINGTCVRALSNDEVDAPVKRASKGKSCGYDGDCDPGSRCIKGSGPEGICLGH